MNVSIVDRQTLNYKDYTISIHMVPSLSRRRTEIFKNLLCGSKNLLFSIPAARIWSAEFIAMLGLKTTVLRTP